MPCTGKREKEKVEEIKHKSDFTLNSIYRDGMYLEDYEALNWRMKRKTDIFKLENSNESKRQRSESFCSENYFVSRGRKWKRFKSALKERKTRILYMPIGMSRQKQNKSFFKPVAEESNDNLSFGIFWTLRFTFDQESIMLNKINENNILSSVLAKNITKSKSLYLKNENKLSKREKPLLRVDSTKTIKQLLQEQTIIEFPEFVAK